MNNPEYLERDFYADLGVSKDASQADIKKAYRKLAQQHHPDANKGDKASEERFKEVGRAYAVLSDPKKRAEYDEARRLLASGAFGGGGFGGFPGGGGGFPGGGRVRVEGLGGLGDLFGNLFGGGRQSQGAARRGRDVESEVTLGFEEAVRGATIPLQLRGPAPCHTCHGSGAKPGTPALPDLQRARHGHPRPGPVRPLQPLPDLPGSRLGDRRPLPDLPGPGQRGPHA